MVLSIRSEVLAINGQSLSHIGSKHEHPSQKSTGTRNEKDHQAVNEQIIEVTMTPSRWLTALRRK